MSVEEWLTAVFWVLVALLMVVSAHVGSTIAERRVSRPTAGFWLGLLLGPLGLIVAGLLGRDEPQYPSRGDGPGMR